MGIDAVITWVDGNDEEYQRRKKNFFSDPTLGSDTELVTGRDRTRFTDNGELKYAVYSILEFAPWIERIFLITDGQTPLYFSQSFMDEHRIVVIDHKEIFRDFEWALPTYNNRTIETALWRIPGLSEHFIYFNDDFVLLESVSPEDFFQNGKVVLRGEWKHLGRYGFPMVLLNRLYSRLLRSLFGITRSMHILQQMKSAQEAGFREKYFRFPHVPHPLRKSTLEHFFSENPDRFKENIQYKVRDVMQFSSVFLAHHLEILSQSAVLKDTSRVMMLNGELDFSLTLKSKLRRIEEKDCTFLSLQGFEKYDASQKEKIRNLLSSLLINT